MAERASGGVRGENNEERALELKTTQAARDEVRAAAAKLDEYKAIPREEFPGAKEIACANLEGYLGTFARALADDVDLLLAERVDRV